MTVWELRDALNCWYERNESVDDMEVEIHRQPQWPIKSGVSQIRILNGKVVLATGDDIGYADEAAWDAWELEEELPAGEE